jgi:hypothetical protein
MPMAIQSGFSFNDTAHADFDPEDYWGSREFKVWVVTLRHVARRGKRQRRVYNFTVKYVRARAPEAAAAVARRNHFGRERICGIGVRLATPTDLGAVRAGPAPDGDPVES